MTKINSHMSENSKKLIQISYKRADEVRVLELKENLVNVLGQDCCTTVATDDMKQCQNTQTSDLCKVFILVYSTNLSVIDGEERNALVSLIRHISLQNDARIIIVTLDTMLISEWLEDVLPRQQVTNISNYMSMQVLYNTLHDRIKNVNFNRINTIPDEIFKVGELYYKAINGTEVEITEVFSKDEDKYFFRKKEVTIPETIIYEGYEYKVVGIGDHAFRDFRFLSKITIPNGIKRIDNGAFVGCDSLKSLIIPKSVEKIDRSIFSENLDYIAVDKDNKYYDSRNDCNAIIETASQTMIIGTNNTVVPEKIRTIGKEVCIRSRTLESVVIPNGILIIEEKAFFDCWELKSVDISDSVMIIEDHAFAYCDNLTSVTLGKNIKKIGRYAFYNVSHHTGDDINRLPTIYVPKGLKDRYSSMLHEYFKDKIVER